MWTPKRILLLASGFILFLSGYFVYSHFLGGIDGLPPLPDRYRPDPNHRPVELAPLIENMADRLLREAFGQDCDEVKNRKFKLEVQPKGIVLATNDTNVTKDGRLEIVPFSIAIFGKDKNDGKGREITTVRCKRAYLRFEKPITSIHEIGKSKITDGELQEDIFVINNRRTPQHDDDVSLFTQGPLFYQESRNQIWTKEPVLMTDPSCKPHPMEIRGTGMDIYLLAEDKNPAVAQKPSAPKGKTSSVNGVKTIELRSDVEMNLWVDARSGFVGPGKNPLPPPGAVVAQETKPAPEPEKTKLVIRTQGKFQYDMVNDWAVFHNSELHGGRPNFVTVNRHDEAEGKMDQLESDHLELQFTRKSPVAGAPVASERTEGLDLLTVKATGKEVVVASEAENLEAHGNEFTFNKVTRLSTLKGAPTMWALKDGNSIKAPELQLLDQKGKQQATALGEGQFRLLDKTTGKWTAEAKWKTRCVYGKEGPYDVLTLQGGAQFVDPEKNQQLQAENLKVVLEPVPPAPGAKDDQPKHRPHYLEAIGQVTASSPEMHVHDTERLVIRFKPGPRPGSVLPPAVPDQKPDETVPGTQPAPAQAAVPGQPVQGGAASAQAQANPKQLAGLPNTSKKPLNLSARLIDATVQQAENKNDLEKVWCEGQVRVLQDPETPKDKGIDIKGDTLDLKHYADGNVLVVTGDSAEVQLNQILILGPEVTINQTSNEAWVNRQGYMRLPSNGNLGGLNTQAPNNAKAAAPKAEPPGELTIGWDKKMYFNGQEARFEGNVTAEQGTGRLNCQDLRVNLDRKVSLKDGDKGREPAKVQKVVCDKEVEVEDIRRENNKILSLRRINSVLLSIDNDPETEESHVEAPGPGIVRLYDKASKAQGVNPAVVPNGQSNSAPKDAAQPVANAQEEPKLTHVTYAGKMYANNKAGIAKFYDQVVVIHVPTSNPDLKIDEDRPGPGYMRMSCERLEVLTRKLKDGKTEHEMRGDGKVSIEGQGYFGRGDVVKYDESKEQIILEGHGSPAIFQQDTGQGRPRKQIKATKIIYNRRTGEAEGQGIQSIDFIR